MFGINTKYPRDYWSIRAQIAKQTPRYAAVGLPWPYHVASVQEGVLHITKTFIHNN